MTKKLVLATLIAAVAIITAPAAGASPDGTKCGKRGGGASVCQKPGHSSLHTEPSPLPSLPSGGGLFGRGWMPGYGGPVLPTAD